MKEFFGDHLEDVIGTNSCFDRVVIMGSLPDICHSRAMAGHLSAQGIRLFDFTKWAEPLRNELRRNAEAVAAQEGLAAFGEIRPRRGFRRATQLAAAGSKSPQAC